MKPLVDPVLTSSKYRQSFATSAAWDASTHTLFTGDFAGQICAWDLRGIAAALQTHTHPKARTVYDGTEPLFPGIPGVWGVGDYLCRCEPVGVCVYLFVCVYLC